MLAGSIINSICFDNGGQRKNQSWIDGNLVLSGSAAATYTLTKEEIAGEGNLAKDPLLKADYTLGRSSPAINAGSNQDWMKGAFDLSGEKRIIRGRVDIGCYERFMQGFSICIR